MQGSTKGKERRENLRGTEAGRTGRLCSGRSERFPARGVGEGTVFLEAGFPGGFMRLTLSLL